MSRASRTRRCRSSGAISTTGASSSSAGQPPDDEVLVVSGSIEERSFLALYGRDGRLHGVLGMNLPRLVMKFRPLLAQRATLDEAIDLAAELG